MRSVRLLLLLALLLALPAARATAAVRLGVPEGVTVRPGDRIELAWEGLDRGVREVEFELSLDGGRWVRISPELEALEGHWTWRVPELSAAEARIRLRCGGERREEVAATGGVFVIAGGTRSEQAREFLGEWWPALDRGVRHAAPIGLCAGEAPVLAAARATAIADAPSPFALAPPAREVATYGTDTRVARPATPAHARSMRPRFVPLRN